MSIIVYFKDKDGSYRDFPDYCSLNYEANFVIITDTYGTKHTYSTDNIKKIVYKNL